MHASRDYFAAVAGKWDEIRSGYFTAEMRDAAIRKANIAADAVVADVGTGTGFVLQGLLSAAAELVGFDESPEMIAVARENFRGQTHVHFRVAKGQHLPADPGTFDAVFANMYLHHTPDPAAAIREMTRILKPGGKLVIIDLDSHEQEWMRAAMADRWLGFERDELRQWYAQVGLQAINIDCAAGTCDCSRPDDQDISLSIFVAIGEK